MLSRIRKEKRDGRMEREGVVHGEVMSYPKS